ncbi:unnamed protein product (macronuclear) [Paramecium tetraurelia]|uniref:Uncharacterized protein n=1 Tax=Paramecium tetraurelia TaxID=5888 RepID=A0E190_PARTE|nr:uncharacterized protein GSPATT00022226001 [Paramecium tetraurelia]CAK89057.1 unnamed protein product [Paramecium tetraurelia]|eukprot:XP_001456454.1 hypothetical protein (macronuclear) [Paramecium tetraurelia strain d4-2]
MQDRILSAYRKGKQTIALYQDSQNKAPGFQLNLNNFPNISIKSIDDIDIPNSLRACLSFQISKYYDHFALINAFNVLQSEIELMRNIYEIRENPFAVWLCDQGEWKISIVDDQVLCLKNSDETLFKCTYQWAIIIEKAVAKLLGNSYNQLNRYNRLYMQFDVVYFKLLIGQPITQIQMNRIEELRTLLEQKSSIFYIEVNYKQRNNAYVILSIKENQVELQAINQESICDAGVKQNDSKFLFSWNEFQQYPLFQVHLNKNSQIYTFTMQQPMERKLQFIEHTYIYNFQINKKDTYWISICQRDQNFNSLKQQQEIKYGLIRFLLFKNHKKSYQLISDTNDFNQNLYHRTELEKGKYTLLCQAEFYNLELLSQELQNQQKVLKLQIQGLKPPQNFDQSEQSEGKLKELMVAIIRQTSKANRQNIGKLQKEGFPQVQMTMDNTIGFMYIYYENHGDLHFEEYLQFNIHENLINYETQQMETFRKVSIPPKEYMLLLYKFDPRTLLQSPVIRFKCQVDFKIKPSVFEYIYFKQDVQFIEIQNLKIFIMENKKGVLLHFVNQSNNIRKVECELKLNNLLIVQNENLTLKDKIANFEMKSKSNYVILLNFQNPQEQKYNCEIKVNVQPRQ